MQELNESTLSRLRDRMWEVAAKHDEGVVTSAGSLLADAGVFTEEEEKFLQAMNPVFELLFLIMAADGELHPDEQSVIIGAAAHLSHGFMNRDTMKAMLDRYERMLRDQGWELRMSAATFALRDDPELAELALNLAGAVAIADGKVDARENDVLRQISSLLGFESNKVESLIASLELEASGDI